MFAKGYEYDVVDGGVRIVRCTAHSIQLVIPEFIGGIAVRAIAPYAFEGNSDAREIECPPGIVEIGSRAFANCAALERIAFPADLERYDNSWIAGCTRLAEIVLPGAIVDLDLPSPAPTGVKSILVGAKARSVRMARTWKTRLLQVRVHPDNPWLSADGACIYSADGTELIAHATSSSEVSVAQGCRRIAARAFEHEQHLERISLPDSLLSIGERAFAESGLRCFDSPQGLEVICPEAFASCKELGEVRLGVGLREIGERAFWDCTACLGLHIPEGVVRVGRKAFEDSGLRPCGDEPTLTMSARNRVLFIDDAGVLCENGADGVVVREALDMATERYRTPVGTARIADRAFFGHPRLEQLELGEGVTCVGQEAFMRCERLRSISLPASLRRLEARAFATTALRSCTLPAGVDHLGECSLAFNFKNWHPTTNPPAARSHVSLEPGNARFFVEGGLLYERCEDGGLRVLLYVGPDIDVEVAQEARDIAPYAFFGVQGVRELRLPARIPIGEATFAMRKPPDRIVLAGDDGIVFETMHDWRGVCALQRSFAGGGTTSARLLCATFDEEVLGAQLDYEAYRYLLGRLVRPVHLQPDVRHSFDRIMRENLGAACLEFARHDGREHIDQLVDVGLISGDTIDAAIEAASAANSAPVMARLHELKRTRFAAGPQDYGL